MNLNIDFKHHIQSLRGISVILVIFYHLNIDYFSKGYLGVDIFFVISGYVITQRLYKDYLENKKISIMSFYLRRFFRIFPNLFFIVSFVYVFYLIFGPPDRSLYKSAIFSIFGLSNLFFLFENKNYFDTLLGNLLSDPLSHTWSLGIEEQFYLIYPFILFVFFTFTKKNKINKTIFFLVIVLITSLIASLFLQYELSIANKIESFFSLILYKIFGLPSNPPKELIIFYFPFFRFWEFIVGCIFFFIGSNVVKNNLLSILSLLVMCFILFLSTNLPYLLNNIIIVFASGTFILFYKDEAIINNKVLLYLGKISYSLYLWHLPIIYFSSVYFGNFYSIFYTIILTPIFSIITYEHIEKKFRIIIFNRKKIYQFMTLVIVSFTLLFYLKYYNNNLKENIRNFITEANYLEKKFNWTQRTVFSKNLTVGSNEVYSFCHEASIKFTINDMGLREECLKQKNNNILFYVEGDSQTAQFLTALNEIDQVENLYYKWSRSVTNFSSKHSASYDEVNDLSKKFNKVIYVTDIYSNDRFTEMQKKVKKFNKNISFLFFNSNVNLGNEGKGPLVILPLSCLIRKYDCVATKEKDVNARELKKLNDRMNDYKNNNNNIEIFDSYELLCPKEECVVYDKEKDILMYRDATHLTKEAVRSIKKDLSFFLDKNYFKR